MYTYSSHLLNKLHHFLSATPVVAILSLFTMLSIIAISIFLATYIIQVVLLYWLVFSISLGPISGSVAPFGHDLLSLLNKSYKTYTQIIVLYVGRISRPLHMHTHTPTRRVYIIRVPTMDVSSA